MRLAVRGFGIVGPIKDLPDLEDRTGFSGIRCAPGDTLTTTQALRLLYPLAKLRRLDAYSQSALLAAKLAQEVYDIPPDNSGIIVCTGYGPIPATNAFMDSYLDFGPQGASPTAFSQTVHNLAASTISTFLDFRGPTLSISQPGLGCSSALFTAQSWMTQGLVDTVLFGAVDDSQAFSCQLFTGEEPQMRAGGPLAAFASLTANNGGNSLLEVLDVGLTASSAAETFTGQYGPGPVNVLTGFLSVLNGMYGRRDAYVVESWDDLVATIHVRSMLDGGES